jgi:exportin-7
MNSPSNTSNNSSNSNNTNNPNAPVQSLLSQLPELEELCTVYYTAYNNESRAKAAELLKNFTTNYESITQCRFILEYSSNDYSLHFASSAMLKLFSNYFNVFSTADTIDLKNFLLNFLASKGPKLASHIVNNIITLTMRIVKLSWRLDSSHSNILADISKFFTHTPAHMNIGLRMIIELVAEMNLATSYNNLYESLSDHRKTARLFRDNSLQQIFTQLLSTTAQFTSNQANAINDKNLLEQIYYNLVTALCSCLTFDFIGSAIDESYEDITPAAVQIPTNWRNILESPDTIRIFMELLTKLNSSKTIAQCIELLGLLSSVRRSIFSSDQARLDYLNRLTLAIQYLLSNHGKLILADSSVYHAMAVFLSRYKVNYPLLDILSLNQAEQALQIIAKFSIEAIKRHDSSFLHSAHYFLNFWSKVAFDLTLFIARPEKSLNINYLIEFLTQFAQVYIKSSTDAVMKKSAADDEEDYNEEFHDTIIAEILRLLPQLIKFNYEKNKTFLQQLFEQLMRSYKAAVDARPSTGPTKELLAAEGQLALFCYFTSAAIAWDKKFLVSFANSADPTHSNPYSFLLTVDSDDYDAQLCALLYQLCSAFEFRCRELPAKVSRPVPLARSLLYFLAQVRSRFLTGSSLRSVYVADSTASLATVYNAVIHDSAMLADASLQSKAPSSFYTKLSALNVQPCVAVEAANIPVAVDPKVLAQHMLALCLKILSNYSGVDIVIAEALDTLQQLTEGFTSSNLLIQADYIQQFINNHKFDYFPFLNEAKRSSLNTQFYAILGRLLFRGQNMENVQLFISFMQPFDEVFQRIASQGANLKNLQIAQATIQVCRKLQGLFQAAQGETAYNKLFDWLFEYNFPIIIRVFETFYDNYKLVKAVLSLFSDIALNQNQRIKFNTKTASTVLLFSEISKAIRIYGNRLLTFQVDRANPAALAAAQSDDEDAEENEGKRGENDASQLPADDAWVLKLHGISLCLKIIIRCLCGTYIPFGVMSFYQDKSLKETLHLLVKLLMSIRLADLFVYPEFIENYFLFIQTNFRNHLELLLELESAQFMALCLSLQEGLVIHESKFLAVAAEGFDELFGFYIQTNKKINIAKSYNNNTKTLQEQLLAFQKHFESKPDFLIGLFSLLLNIYLFDGKIQNLWVLPKPIYSCLCVRPDLLNHYKQRLISMQPAELRSRLASQFEILVEGLHFNAELGQKDKFFSNLATFKAAIVNYTIKPHF